MSVGPRILTRTACFLCLIDLASCGVWIARPEGRSIMVRLRASVFMLKKGRSFTAIPKLAREDSDAGELLAKRSWFDLPDGTLGILFLLLLASFCGALIAVYWPFGQGQGEANMGDRILTLEAKVDEIAASHASLAAAQAFVGQSREIVALRSRVDADEARLALMERSE